MTFIKGALPPPHRESCDCFRCYPEQLTIRNRILNPIMKFHTGYKHSDEVRKIIGEKGKGRIPWNYKTYDENYLKRMSKLAKKRKLGQLGIAGKETRFKKGHKTWNKGLTKETNESLRLVSENIADQQRQSLGQGAPMYIKGRRFEYRVRKRLERLGFYVMRHAGSKFPDLFPDLFAAKKGKSLILECKAWKYFSRSNPISLLSDDEQKKAYEIMNSTGVPFLLAYRDNKKIKILAIGGNGVIDALELERELNARSTG